MCKHAPDQDQTRLNKTKPLLFSLGQVFVTRGAVDLLDRIGLNAEDLLSRHQRGDWGDVHDGDIVANNHPVLLNAFNQFSGGYRGVAGVRVGAGNGQGAGVGCARPA